MPISLWGSTTKGTRWRDARQGCGARHGGHLTKTGDVRALYVVDAPRLVRREVKSNVALFSTRTRNSNSAKRATDFENILHRSLHILRAVVARAAARKTPIRALSRIIMTTDAPSPSRPHLGASLSGIRQKTVDLKRHYVYVKLQMACSPSGRADAALTHASFQSAVAHALRCAHGVVGGALPLEYIAFAHTAHRGGGGVSLGIVKLHRDDVRAFAVATTLATTTADDRPISLRILETTTNLVDLAHDSRAFVSSIRNG